MAKKTVVRLPRVTHETILEVVRKTDTITANVAEFHAEQPAIVEWVQRRLSNTGEEPARILTMMSVMYTLLKAQLAKGD